jgi:hypothetical protein
MAIATVSPISITEIIPYSLLEDGRKPIFGNRSVEKFLLSAKEALQQARPNNISLVIAVAPGQKLVNEPWNRRYKPDSITFYTFFNKNNTFAAIEAISDTLAEIYGQTKILPLTDAWPATVMKDLPDDWYAKFTNSGCLIYSE